MTNFSSHPFLTMWFLVNSAFKIYKRGSDCPPPHHNEHLSLVNPHRDCSFDIWVLGEYGNEDSWSMLFSILPPLLLEPPAWRFLQIFAIRLEPHQHQQDVCFS